MIEGEDRELPSLAEVLNEALAGDPEIYSLAAGTEESPACNEPPTAAEVHAGDEPPGVEESHACNAMTPVEGPGGLPCVASSAPAPAALILETGRGRGRSVRVTRSPFVIGRDEGCALKPRHDAVSRRHCVLEWRDRWWLRDLGSTNGTVVAGVEVRAAEVPLADGDVIDAGPLRLVFHTSADADPSHACNTPSLDHFGSQLAVHPGVTVVLVATPPARWPWVSVGTPTVSPTPAPTAAPAPSVSVDPIGRLRIPDQARLGCSDPTDSWVDAPKVVAISVTPPEDSRHSVPVVARPRQSLSRGSSFGVHRWAFAATLLCVASLGWWSWPSLGVSRPVPTGGRGIADTPQPPAPSAPVRKRGGRREMIAPYYG
jgi:predicted component of type VI protein secretion system